jgi:hypothetical protein
MQPRQQPIGHAERSRRLAAQFYPEVAVGGFSRVDWAVAFWSQVGALLQPSHVVLDFGAGRSEHIADDPVAWRRNLAMLDGEGATVVQDAEAGIAVAAGDSEELAAAIIQLIEMPPRDRADIGAPGRLNTFRHYRMNGPAQQLETWFGEMMSPQQKSGSVITRVI